MLRGIFQKLGAPFSGRKLDEDLLDEWQEQMIMSDVSVTTSEHLLDKLRDAAQSGEATDDTAALEALKQETIELLGKDTAPLRFASGATLTVWLIAGVNGVGKTTTAGKIAYWAKSTLGYRPLLAAADTFRAAAIEQLQEWGRRADVEVVAQQQGADPAAVVFDAIAAAIARGHDLLIIDTAGRLHNKTNLMNELAKIARIIERETGQPAHETLLVLDATTGQNGLTQALSFAGSAPLTGIVLTKWDGTAKGGIVLTIANETNLPVKLLGVGEKMEDICDFDAKEFVETLFS
jgi:fused signal recognition particle receptor